ncbi:hypothetical protein LCGC14_1126970 [marine sediment metagenome]|uniref:Uncharacterized protein n=1 Tax=marine sediment metagenome TaxID=412755 RepID=A0A0F9M711_9ZZZZ
MKDKQKIDPKEAEKQRQMAEAVRLLGAKHPELVRQYQHIFLKNANGRAILKDILGDTKIFAINLREEDLAVRNYGSRLLHTIAGAHINPLSIDKLFSMFIDALAEYERTTTPIDERKIT